MEIAILKTLKTWKHKIFIVLMLTTWEHRVAPITYTYGYNKVEVRTSKSPASISQQRLNTSLKISK